MATNVDEAHSTPAEVAYDQRSPFRPARQDPLLTRAIPVSGEIPRYRGPSARRDAVAGVTVAALAIPSAMAYAEVAGLSPVSELYYYRLDDRLFFANAGVLDAIGRSHLHPTVRAAVDAYTSRDGGS
jgi:MFS superfamily sulfate permease-like transporter